MMDPNTGTFQPATDPKADPGRANWPRFHVGQELEIGGVRMRVRKITAKDVILRPCPAR